MKVIVDSGSTKADWKFITSDSEIELNTMGFNPVFHNSDQIEAEITKAFTGKVDFQQEADIYFYGSGCWDKKRKLVIENGLKRVWKTSLNPGYSGITVQGNRVYTMDRPSVEEFGEKENEVIRLTPTSSTATVKWKLPAPIYEYLTVNKNIWGKIK